MRRLAPLLALIVAAMARPALADPPATRTVVLWHSYQGHEERALQEVVKAFEAENPAIHVRLMAVPYGAFANKIRNAVPNGNGPDLFIYGHDQVGQWAKDGVIEPLDPKSLDVDTTKFLPETVKGLTYQGHLYGLPLAYKSVALIYNKALVQVPPKTTDEMLAIAEGLSLPAKGEFGLAYPTDDFYSHGAWLFGFGGHIFDPKTGKPDLDTPGFGRSLAFLQKLVLKDHVVPEEATYVLTTRLFNSGAVGMVVSGPWFLSGINKDINYGIAPLPVVSATGKPATPFLTVEGIFLAARAHDPGDALALASFIAGKGAVTRAIDGRQPVAWAPAYQDPRILDDPDLMAFRHQLDHTRLTSNRPIMSSVWDPAKGALEAVLRGVPPAQAMKRAEARLKALTRPAPPRKSPTPYLLLLGLVALVGAGSWTGRELRRIKAGGHSRWAEVKKAKGAYAYLAPAALGMLLLVLVPFAVGVGMGFTHHEAGHYTFVGLANFTDILFGKSYGITDPLSFYFTMVVTILWTVANVVLHVTIGLALALLLKEQWLKLKGVYRALLIIPWAVPSYITALIWKGMFQKQFGAINGLLTAIGLQPVSWFSHFWTAFTADVVTNTWLGFPFMMVVALGALQSIPADLYEAAEVDGASAWQRFRHVTLPLLRPAMLPAVILGMVWTFNMFNVIYLVSNGAPGGATDILISDAYRWAFERGAQYGYAAAYATLIFIILVVYTLATHKVAGGEELT